MKAFVAITAVAALIIFSIPLPAQNNDERKYSIQFDHGVSKTLHYNQPVNFYTCFEGCHAVKQLERTSHNFDISLYRELDGKNSVKAGVGFSEYRFWERILASPGNGPPTEIHEMTHRFRYFDITTGYRRIFGETPKTVSPFFEAEILFEIYRDESDFLKTFGVGVKPSLGVLVRVSDDLMLVLNGFYKSGITAYNKETYNKDYIPFSYGLEVGLNMKPKLKKQ